MKKQFELAKKQKRLFCEIMLGLGLTGERQEGSKCCLQWSERKGEREREREREKGREREKEREKHQFNIS